MVVIERHRPMDINKNTDLSKYESLEQFVENGKYCFLKSFSETNILYSNHGIDNMLNADSFIHIFACTSFVKPPLLFAAFCRHLYDSEVRIMI